MSLRRHGWWARRALGWSSWSLQSTKYPGVNTQGDYSWLTEQHVLEQAQVMSTQLRSHGYQYINIDAGWWRKWDWTPWSACWSSARVKRSTRSMSRPALCS